LTNRMEIIEALFMTEVELAKARRNLLNSSCA
jgi:hypothetical protein